MGKTKTVFLTGQEGEKLSSEEKYKQKQKRKLEEEAQKKAAVSGVGLKGGERIKVIGADEPLPEVVEETAEAEKKLTKAPKVRGKKYKSAVQKIDKSKLYKISDAIKLAKTVSISKFDGSVDLHIQVKKIGTSAKVNLPHATGKTKKIEVADDKTIEKLKKGNVDFDVLLSTPDMMPKLVPFAKLLGPKGLMPNPKAGTLIKDKKEAEKFSASTLNLKTEKKAPIIHTSVGKVSQKEKELEENVGAVVEAIGKNQIVKAYITPTMGPSVKLQV